MPDPVVSVVVIGRNEGDRLKRCLASIRAMQPLEGEVELIYVDSRSTDKSLQVAEAAGASVVVLDAGRFTAGRSRNAGLEEASAPFVFFVDGDTVLDQGFVVHALPVFDDPQVAVVFGWTREIAPNKSIFHRMFDVQWQAYGVGPVDTCMGTALFRRSALDAAGGWDSEMTGSEEGELCGRLRRLGFVILGIDHRMVAHDLTMTSWRQYWWRMLRNSYGITETIDRFRPEEMKELRYRRRHTLVWGTLLVTLPAVAVVCSFVWATWLPLGMLLAFLGSTLLHTAWKSRGLDGGVLNWLAFGLHRYLKEVPRLAGLIRYFRDKRKGQRSLIDYKGASCTVYKVEGTD